MSSASSLENVLILQGGGSLGAFGCGVFKALANNNVKLDIIADIIAGSKDDKNPEKVLEQFCTILLLFDVQIAILLL